MSEQVKRYVPGFVKADGHAPEFKGMTECPGGAWVAHDDYEKVRKEVEHVREWYAVRWERIRDYAKEHGWWDKAAAIFANGSLTMTDGVVYEPPHYGQQLNMAKHRAEAAEAHIEAQAAEIAGLKEYVGELNDLLDAAKHERDAAEANERRYLWLRNHDNAADVGVYGVIGSPYLDAAIDDAMRGGAE